MEKVSKYDYRRAHVYKNYPEEPKFLFVKVCDIIAEHGANPNSIFDVGGAFGQFGDYAQSRFPSAQVTVLEHDKDLVELGEKKFPHLKFYQGDANQVDMCADQTFEVTTMQGVHNIFDDFSASFNECIRVTKDGGYVVVADIFNEFEIDALIYWRHANRENAQYTRGHNVFSTFSINRYLSQHQRVDSFSYEPFIPPFELPRSDDPMRSWIETSSDGERYLRDALMTLDFKILKIKLK